jgi:uncharacterized Ntn-hydrolase superfamily protein
MKNIILALLISFPFLHVSAQDTFSIVAVDSVTGEVGSAGASCVDLILFFPNYATDFLGDLIPGVGAINTQASYNATNQTNARTRMLAGDNPQQIISWLTANDVQNNPNSRQYGIASLVNGSPQTAGFTGTGTLNYKNHITGPNYSIQGNILLGQAILDSIEARFLNAQGDLACKLMAALQGAKVPGADTRCANNGTGTSSLFAFLKVSQPSDPYGSPSFKVSVKTPGGFGIEPIDSLQVLFDAQRSCTPSSVSETSDIPWRVFPNPAGDLLHLEILASNWNPSTSVGYKLIDNNGRRVAKGTFKGRQTQLDLSDLPTGLYNLELVSEGLVLQRKVVRK